ncbi:MAG TPA: hypothetical protein VIY52_03015 [Streptosporangiaceae bacterium]
MTAAPPGDPGGARVEMRGESRESSTFTQIGTQVNYQPPLPEQAFRPWAELGAPDGYIWNIGYSAEGQDQPYAE